MAAIKIQQFGGVLPSVDPRNLPADGAQVAENLDMRYGDFRPVQGPGSPVATVAAGCQSIFRTPSGVWLSSTGDVDYVNGQVPDAASERVYLTGNAAYPQAWQGGVYRRLGVPAPALKPTVVLSAVDEFDSVDADVAQKAAIDAVLGLAHAATSATLLGRAPPAGILSPVPDPDPIYADVALHLKFDALTGGLFTDSSPQALPITHETGVSLLTDNSGPLGVAGAGCARLTGGTSGGITFPEVRRWRTEENPRWTMDFWIKPDVDLEFISLESRDGNLREVTFITPGGSFKTLAASHYGGLFYTQLRVKRPSGANICAANTAALISVQNNGTAVEVYVDGILCGTTPNMEGLELSIIGRSHWTTANAFTGRIDEVRVTLGARYSGAFTPPTAPYGTAAVPTGFWVMHGDPLASGLPTNSADDAAYLVQLSLVGGSYVATNTADQYLLAGTLGGSLVTYSGSKYWAIPGPGYRAVAQTINEATLVAALTTLDNPATPGTDLLTPVQATDLGAAMADAFDPILFPLLGLVTTLNTEQARLQELLSTHASASDIVMQLSLMKAASSAVETYFTSMDANLTVVMTREVGGIFGSIASKVVTRTLETRAYIVTYVSDWDEESAPSPPSDLLETDQNDEVLVTVPTPPAGRNVIGWRIYRSSSSNTGAAYQMVVDKTVSGVLLNPDGTFRCYSISGAVVTDKLVQKELQESCPSLTWGEPPENMTGLVGLPNGIMAGFFGHTLCFSEPYEPYAWPVEYQHSLEFDIVAIRVFGQTAVVLTEGNPYFASGADSASMSTQKLEAPQACIAKRTAVAVEGGVLYASPDGLCLASPSGVSVVTQGAFDRKDWLEAVGSGAFGAFHDGAYYLFGN